MCSQGDNVFARAAGTVEVAWTKVAVTRGAGLGGEFKFRVDLYMLSMRCMLASSRQWASATDRAHKLAFPYL